MRSLPRTPRTFILTPLHSPPERSIFGPATFEPTATITARRRDHRARVLVSAYDLRAAGSDGDDVDGLEEVWVWRRTGFTGGLPIAEVSGADCVGWTLLT